MASKVPERLVAKRGVFMKMWDNFVASFSVSKRRTIVGEDHLGNIYYEADPQYTSKRGSLARGYLPGSKANWKEIPTEWESWLRGRRKEIPDQEEINRNMAMAELRKQRVFELDLKRRQEDAALASGGTVDGLLTAQAGIADSEPQTTAERTQALPNIGSDTGDQHRTAFPTYGKDFETSPGVHTTHQAGAPVEQEKK